MKELWYTAEPVAVANLALLVEERWARPSLDFAAQAATTVLAVRMIVGLVESPLLDPNMDREVA